MNMLLRRGLTLLLLGVLVALAFAAGVYYAPAIRAAHPLPAVRTAPTSARTEQALSVLHEAWRLIERDYYGQLPDETTLVSAAVHGLVSALDDPFSAYQSAAEVASFQRELDGSLQSLGMAVEKRDHQLIVVAPLSASPAQRAGIYPRDQIVTIDGRETAGLTLGEAMALLRGPRGSTVSLTVIRNSTDVLPFTIERATEETPFFAAHLYPDGMLYVNISLFDSSVARDLRQALQQHDVTNLRGIVLDLRNNPGGFLDVAIEIAGFFIGDGLIVTQETRAGRYQWSFANDGRLLVIDGPDGRSTSPVRQGTLAVRVPVVALVNEGTASAAEVLAAALQDHRRAVLLGQPTFGKSAISGDYTLSDGSAIRLSNGRWLSPNGRTVENGGLVPDERMPAAPDDSDALITRAMERVVGQP